MGDLSGTICLARVSVGGERRIAGDGHANIVLVCTLFSESTICRK